MRISAYIVVECKWIICVSLHKPYMFKIKIKKHFQITHAPRLKYNFGPQHVG